MMAYRSSVHETTGMTPNMLMFGREVSTRLELAYEMPSSIKDIPSNKWVLELQERIENAHAFVRNKMNQSMVRQKHYHDRKLKWHHFEEGEQVYVFFPRRKQGTSPKFTSYWQGPFRVIKSMSELTYLVNCGPRGSDQVIHVDRMRKKRPQVLSGEVDQPITPETPEDSGSVYGEDIEVPEMPHSDRPSRNRRPPIWLHDYETDVV